MKDIKNIPEQFAELLPRLKRYLPVFFCLMLALLYGFLVYQVQMLKKSEPSTQDIANQVKTANVPPIDKNVIKQLKTLQDNSVSVQALFDQARSNPFQE